MATDPHPHLLFPTCAECQNIGVYVAPFLSQMERQLGAGIVRAFLLDHGGRQFDIPNYSRMAAARAEEDHAKLWLRDHVGFGRITIPLGPAGRAARIAWTTYRMLREGQSLAAISRRTESHSRSVSARKQKFIMLGLLPGIGQTHEN